MCTSNCDEITPGMLNAAMRSNVPTVFVSRGRMEAGKVVGVDGVEQAACPTCGSCSGMSTGNSMNWPAGGPGVQETLHPTAFLKGAGGGARAAGRTGP